MIPAKIPSKNAIVHTVPKPAMIKLHCYKMRGKMRIIAPNSGETLKPGK
jgi:hypothetical protein